MGIDKSPKRRLNEQKRRESSRAKYGPKRKPSNVVVKKLDEFGNWVEQDPVPQWEITGRTPPKWARHRRRKRSS